MAQRQDNEDRRMNIPLQIATILLETLEKEGIRYCHWKSNQRLAEALAGYTDMDLLVDKSQAALCEGVLTSLGYRRFISQAWARYPGIEDWIGFDDESGELAHLHLHYQLVLGKKFVKEQHLPWEDLILDSALKDSTFKVFITDPNLEIILLVIRIGLKTSLFDVLATFGGKDLFPENIWYEFNYLREQIDEDVVQKCATDLLGDVYGRQVWSIIQQRSLKKPAVILHLKSVVNQALARQRRYSQIKTFGLYLYRFLLSFFARIRRKLRIPGQVGKRLPTGGAIIAVIGCDGSGKSTLSSEVQRWLAWKIDTHKIYLGSGDGSVGLPIKFLRYLASSSTRMNEKSQATDQGAGKHGNPQKHILRELGSCLLDLSIANERHQKMMKARQARLGGSILITDRYPQNQFMGIYDGPRVPRGNNDSRVRQFFARREAQKYQEIAAIAPDVVIKLHVPIEVALNRKPAHNIDQIQRKAEITHNLSFMGSKVIDIDASKSLAEVIKSAKKAIWESL